MFELCVQREFCAAHAIAIQGRSEPVHGHNWSVEVVVWGEKLDTNGILLDFHQVERQLDSIIAPFHNGDLNRTAPFDRINPTAEHVAQHIAQSIAQRLPSHVRLRRVTVGEAPGCRATYRMS